MRSYIQCKKLQIYAKKITLDIIYAAAHCWESVQERLKAVKWDGKEFAVTLLGRDFAISHPDYAIRALDEGKLPPLPVQTFLLRYLLESRDVFWAGQWKTFREMPWARMSSISGDTKWSFPKLKRIC